MVCSDRRLHRPGAARQQQRVIRGDDTAQTMPVPSAAARGAILPRQAVRAMSFATPNAIIVGEMHRHRRRRAASAHQEYKDSTRARPAAGARWPGTL